MSTVTAQTCLVKSTEFLSWRWGGGSVAGILHSRITKGAFSPEILVQLAWALAFLKSSPGDVNVQTGRRACGRGTFQTLATQSGVHGSGPTC